MTSAFEPYLRRQRHPWIYSEASCTGKRVRCSRRVRGACWCEALGTTGPRLDGTVRFAAARWWGARCIASERAPRVQAPSRSDCAALCARCSSPRVSTACRCDAGLSTGWRRAASRGLMATGCLVRLHRLLSRPEPRMSLAANALGVRQERTRKKRENFRQGRENAQTDAQGLGLPGCPSLRALSRPPTPSKHLAEPTGRQMCSPLSFHGCVAH